MSAEDVYRCDHCREPATCSEFDRCPLDQPERTPERRQLCGPCDAGLPMSCTCPPTEPAPQSPQHHVPEGEQK